MANGTFIVDRRLGAVRLERLLDVRAQLATDGAINPPITTAGDRPVLAGGQALVADTLYESEKNSGLRYYLPNYRVQEDAGGHPAVELRFSAGDANEAGRLTINMTWTPPAAPGLQARAMEHVASLTLKYRLDVEGAPTPTGPPTNTGIWNPALLNIWNQFIPLQPLLQVGDQIARSTTVFTDKAQFDAVYQAMRDNGSFSRLELRISARVGIRTWRQVFVGPLAIEDQTAVLKNRGALFTQMLHTETFATMTPVSPTGVGRVTVARPPVEETRRVEATRIFVKRREAATAEGEPVFSRTTRMRMAGTVAVRPMATATATPLVVERRAGGFVGGAIRTRPAVMAAPIAATMATTMATPVPAATPAAATATFSVASTATFSPVMTMATLSRVNTPLLAQAVAVSDMNIAGRRVVPIRVALDTTKAPAVVDSDLETTQVLPFTFKPDEPANADVFSVAGFDSGGIHLLLPLRLTAADGSTHIVYQDNLMRDVVHVAPSEFRLERDGTAPFLPSVSFLASEFSTTDNDQDADVLFRVAAVYRLEPWLDPDLVELARAELARQGHAARFTTTVSHDAALTLDLDFLGDEQKRAEAAVDPVTGITDTLDLDHNTFVRLWRERLANPASEGVSGRVDYRLFDGSQAQVKVRLSLWEASAELFDIAFIGSVADHPARYRVMIRNRVESPARITSLPGEILPGGGVAQAVDAASLVGLVLQPQESKAIDYEVSGATDAIAAFEPTVLGRPEPNLPALLKLLMLTPGYSALGFALKVKAADGVFGATAAGQEPLIGLLVEFDDGTRAKLGPDSGEVDVNLVGRLVDQILGTADESQRFFYRVTNLHTSGEGARSSWVEGHGGTTTLQVGTAVVKLDF
jgi:hypothetical protein